MNNSLLNNSLITNSTEKNTINNDSNFFNYLFLLIQNNQHVLILILYILIIIFIVELSLIFYLHKNNKTIKQLCYDNSFFNKRLKRKKNLVIEMGHLSHSIEIK